MKTRKLGSSDLYLTEIGFGAWAIGGGGWAFGWGKQDDLEAISAMQKALELGINWIDTAAVYGLGHSEELVAKATSGIRDKVIIATKCSLIWDETGKISSCLERNSVRRECEASLKRLNTDYIDLYQIHWPDDDKNIEEGWEEIGRLIDEGKVRYGGVSNFSTSHLKRVQAIRTVASLQPPYSMLRRSVEGDLFDYCAEQNIGVVAYSPLQCGLLTGRFDINRVAADDWRRKSPEFNEPNLAINLEFARELGNIALKYEKTTAQFAVSWVLRLKTVTSAIVGARNPEQVIENVGSAGWEISDDDLIEIDQLLTKRIRKIKSANGYLRD